MTAPGPRRVYVYGVVRASHTVPADRTGVGERPAPVRALRAGALAAVISDAPARLRAKRRDLLAHQDLALTLGRDGPVLPMRFGMIAPDEEAVRRQLLSTQNDCLAALERVDGRIEMNLKALPTETGLGSLVREDPEVSRLRTATRRAPGYEASVRLGEAVAHGLKRRATAAASTVLAELSAVADAMVHGPEVEGCVLNVSFLLDRREQRRFEGAVERLTAAHRDRAELRLTGPLPCYSFTEGRA